ncbi:MAG: M50 family metallopeptidase [Alphaproteobacteria bacterium]
MAALSNLFYQTIPFLLIITVLITIHELGHYLAARYYKVAIHTFSIGFGKPLWQKVDKRGVTWQICMLPLGGFVRMASLDLLEIKKETGELSPERFEQLKPFTMEGQSTLGRIIIAFAGPFANILFAVVVMTGLFMYGDNAIRINCVVPSSAAAEAGLKKGDFFIPNTTVDGKTLPIGVTPGNENMFSVTLLQKNGTKAISFEKKEITDTKACGGGFKKNQKYAGIINGLGVSKELGENLKTSFTKSLKNISNYFSGSFQSLAGLLRLNKSSSNDEASVGGIIAIQQATAQISQVSLWHTMLFSTSLSLALAFFNLLPIPILDGGHILLALIEGVARKRLSRKIRGIITFIGLAFLLFLFILLVNIDLLRILA